MEKSGVSDDDASDIIQDKVDGWGLAYHLLIHSKLTKDDSLELAREEISPDSLEYHLLDSAGLINDQEESLEFIKVIADNFLSSKASRIASLLSKNTDLKEK
ncbi:MAG: hypothetical protein PG981_000202 [Wolbachia endosymbiont of Ctenocephalides orientis wCori]|nr:MAG: hypothetical protein PG981_000202 [Wolbachia endosymbiont of Ctenocephalides orientis wCori]